MNIAYFEPLSKAFNRMKIALFKPFDISKWFVVGFTAFLAGLMDWNASGSNFNLGKRSELDAEEIVNLPHIVWEWLTEHPVWFTLIVIGIIIGIIVLIILTWLSSRGKFMFLDNVVLNRAKISESWKKFGKLGNSLFTWRVFFGIFGFIIFFSLLAAGYAIFLNLYDSDAETLTYILTIIGLVLAGIFIAIVFAYISLFLNDFVVPIMYKKELSVMPAWNSFLRLFTRHLFKFLVYGLFVFCIYVLIIICFVLIGLFTCCIGFLLLIIPYISSVITLPVSYTFRAFSIEYLAQFGEDYNLFTTPSENEVII